MDLSLNPVVRTVTQYIARHSLLCMDRSYIVAISGGADSVSLLRILNGLGYKVEAAHCNFKLRGAESDRDEAFVRSLCENLGVACHVVHFDTREYAALHKVSIEMAARNLRYAYFEQLRKDIGAAAICVAHHREDSVETVLINLLRGTGLHGLCGIRPVNGYVVRPLLCLGRKDIEEFLASINQPYITDSSNLEADVVRNKIRLNIMPLLRDINPSVDMSIWHTAERMVEASKVFDRALEDSLSDVLTMKGDTVCVSVQALMEQASPEYVLFKILGKYGFTPQQIEDVFANIHAATGKMFSSKTHDAVFDRGYLLIEPCREAMRPLRMPEEGVYVFAGDKRINIKNVKVGADFRISRSPSVATLDAKDIQFPLTVRTCQLGDRFVPFGMKGFKLVSDYLTDRKKNLFEKRRQLVVADADGNILWLVGERTDNRYRISSDTVVGYVMSIV